MQYFGGKAKIRKPIQQLIKSLLKSGQTYWEPFCGGLWIAEGINTNNMICSDIHLDLILLYNEIKNGWIPPEIISEEEYNFYRNEIPSALRAFIGFGCSFGGKFFGGYARSGDRNYAKNAKNSLLKKLSCIKKANFVHASYDNFNNNAKNWIIYCDPPYKGTTKFSTGNFDHNKFWDWVRNMSKNNVVIVSEYEAPDDFDIILEINSKIDMHSKTPNRKEKIFKFKD